MKKKTHKNLILTFAVIVMVFLAVVAPVQADYVDEENALSNSVSASSIDGSVSSTVVGLQAPGVAADMVEGDSVTRDMAVSNDGISDFKYNLSFSKNAGDDPLCAQLQLSADQNGSTAYSGNLSAFDFDAGTLVSTGTDNWNFTITLPLGSAATYQGKTCDFNFALVAWQTTHTDATTGWSDGESLGGNSITTGDWTGPQISSVVIETENKSADTKSGANSVASVDATISWATDENGTSNVYYDTVSHAAGTYTDYASQKPTPADASADKTSHSITITGLDPSVATTYYYRIVTSDVLGNETISGEGTFDLTNPGYATPGQIVMNEFVPNPIGADIDPMPAGEWIELYNTGVGAVDVNGWYFTDAGGNVLTISAAKTDTGATVVAAGGYLVVYDDSAFSLNNNGDTINFFDFGGTKMDEYTYGDTSGFAEGKTFARIPDGVGPWIDPDGTPGKDNDLGEVELEMYRQMVYEKCFEGEKFNRESKEEICYPGFVHFIGMIKYEISETLNLKEYLKAEAPTPEEVDEVDSGNGADIVEEESQEKSEIIEENIGTEPVVNPDGELDVAENVENNQEEIVDNEKETENVDVGEKEEVVSGVEEEVDESESFVDDSDFEKESPAEPVVEEEAKEEEILSPENADENKNANVPMI